jgi:AcrR family transcriptional regulator
MSTGLEPGTSRGARIYRSTARQEQARRTRRRVVAAATTVFLDRGYAGATMTAIAAEAGVSVPTVELAFGTKSRLLKAAIDVAIVGDDVVSVLDRAGAEAARRAETPEQVLASVAQMIGPAQARSAGLVLAAFEGAATDDELARLADALTVRRAHSAAWIVDTLAVAADLRDARHEAVDTTWLLMDPAVYRQLTRRRGWDVQQYQDWFARSLRRLLVADLPARTHP